MRLLRRRRQQCGRGNERPPWQRAKSQPSSSRSSTSPRLRLSNRRLHLILTAHSLLPLINAIPKLCCLPRSSRRSQGPSLKLLLRMRRVCLHLRESKAGQRGSRTSLSSVLGLRKAAQRTISLLVARSSATYRSLSPVTAPKGPARRGLTRRRIKKNRP